MSEKEKILDSGCSSSKSVEVNGGASSCGGADSAAAEPSQNDKENHVLEEVAKSFGPAVSEALESKF